ncbi:type I restriction enzyme HsdR N-terminal domain-containing protein [Crocinitomix sp.]|nr:type I restriction enzyme HsdR N-terminal domain-containing protein [Crocinitomix sp.]
MYPPLNLPLASLKLKEENIWDELRKKYVKCTPEEWVRQQFIHYLIHHLNYPMGRMVSEYKVNYNGMNKRCDIAIYDENKNAQFIVECKAPSVKITEDTFYQIAKYTYVLKAPYLILTNGMEHYCAYVDRNSGSIQYLQEIPNYNDINK